ncbi:hypothetical protein SASPL_112251 [Salvia splendens]|uniref:Uncharacterized protein n=1 Tax=Salvia splendens TaxID=180675 RepID=A0A8X8Y8R5_SALSN|nr:FK506-binding protein 5-like isoform X1 [Salvia splendens]KAG6428003.1 hypothetical protein SASPL_112251 [Salvia splendens]
MANDFVFTEEEMAVDGGLGYPTAFAKLCRDRSFGPFSHGPPYTFTPYALVQQEEARAKELDELFPLTDPNAKPTTKPKIFLNLLWKQLNHLGNAGFDPEIIRVDPYGNVLYFHADAASPLAWDIDHWFPCSRGGLTVPSNLRILQWQVCRRKHNKLEFLIPWWDLQVGISINQFLSIFASCNSDFRRRAFSWLFNEGESEELNASQTVDSHMFPQHFLESEGRLGLAPAAVVQTRRESLDAPLKSLDHYRRPKSNTPIIASVKKGKLLSKENDSVLMETNPYQAIVMARDSLKQREEASKMQAEIQRLDNEACELQHKSEEDKLSIQELELVLVKKRRRAEKCRRLAESQSSYRVMLEKMIRDAMHQSVVYKEQVRLNQAAASALMARLEAQKAICDSAERELHLKHKQRDELEKQIRPEWEQARKRSRMNDTLIEEDDDPKITLCLLENELNIQQEMEKNEIVCAETAVNTLLCLPDIKSAAHSHKELRKFLEEEQRSSTASPLPNEEREEEDVEGEKNESTTKIRVLKPDLNKTGDDVAVDNEYIVEERLEKLELEDGGKVYNIQFPFPHETEEEEDEESRRQRGKGNIEKWMQFLLENTQEDTEVNMQTSGGKETSRTDELIEKMNMIFPHTDIKDSRAQKTQCTETVKLVGKKMDGQPVASDISEQNSEGDKENDKSMSNIGTPFKNPPYRAVPQKITMKESASPGKGVSSPDEKVRREKMGKERGLVRSESARAFRHIPSSPSLLLEGMKKRVDCIRRKPLVLDDNDGDESFGARKSFMNSSIKTIKKAVRI